MDERESQFRKLVVENHGKIYRICAYHSSGQDDCNDLYQQVLINIWQSLKNFRGESNINTWIYRVALNTSIDFVRAEKRRVTNGLAFRNEMRSLTNQEERWEKIRKEKMLDELQIQINQLSIIDKLIISLMMEKVESKEIAEIVGITEVNVRVKVHRLKEYLKQTMGGNDNER